MIEPNIETLLIAEVDTFPNNDTLIPLLHIADPTAKQIKAAGIQKIALLGTRFTMMEVFLQRKAGSRSQFRILIVNLLHKHSDKKGDAK